jgi:hypothetical protein
MGIIRARGWHLAASPDRDLPARPYHGGYALRRSVTPGSPPGTPAHTPNPITPPVG